MMILTSLLITFINKNTPRMINKMIVQSIKNLQFLLKNFKHVLPKTVQNKEGQKKIAGMHYAIPPELHSSRYRSNECGSKHSRSVL